MLNLERTLKGFMQMKKQWPSYLLCNPTLDLQGGPEMFSQR